MRSSVFVDTWGWLVLANQKEGVFPSVREVYLQEVRSGSPVVTSDYVLDEVVTFLFPKAPASLVVKYLRQLFASVETGAIRLERVGPERFERAWKMRLKYQDHPEISFTDFTSFVIMEETGVKRALTNDRHFEAVNLGFVKVP